MITGHEEQWAGVTKLDKKNIDKIKEAGWRITRQFDPVFGQVITTFDVVFKDGHHFMCGPVIDGDLPSAIASVMSHLRFNDAKEKMYEIHHSDGKIDKYACLSDLIGAHIPKGGKIVEKVTDGAEIDI